MAVPRGRCDGRTTGADAGKAQITPGSVPEVDDGVAAVAQVLDRRDPEARARRAFAMAFAYWAPESVGMPLIAFGVHPQDKC